MSIKTEYEAIYSHMLMQKSLSLTEKRHRKQVSPTAAHYGPCRHMHNTFSPFCVCPACRPATMRSFVTLHLEKGHFHPENSLRGATQRKSVN